jgi:selenocysteine lyase/cysteine desulfurase
MASMLNLRHHNGKALVRIYGPTCCESRGGTITLNLHDSAGNLIDHAIVEEKANKRMISLRTGCFCNPGAGELALGLSKDELVSCFSASDSPMTYDDFRGCVSTEGTGAVRVSTGLVSTFADVFAFLRFCHEFLE